MNFGRYEVLSEIEPGQYLARDPLLERRVVIQMSGEKFEDVSIWARQLALAGGPLVQRLLDLGLTPDQKSYLIREVVEGKSLEEIGPDQSLLEPVRAALAHLHDRGLQHGDLRPANIVLTPEGVLRLTNLRQQGRDDQEALQELEAWFTVR